MKGLIDYLFIMPRGNGRAGTSVVTYKYIVWDRGAIARLDTPFLFESSDSTPRLPNSLVSGLGYMPNNLICTTFLRFIM